MFASLIFELSCLSPYWRFSSNKGFRFFNRYLEEEFMPKKTGRLERRKEAKERQRKIRKEKKKKQKK
jgi:hypothetical protein